MTGPVLVYMPYFASSGHGVGAAQEYPMANFRALEAQRTQITPNCEFRLEGLTGTSEDRLPFLASIWGKYTFVMIESTKAPTMAQLKALVGCPEHLCSQDYRTNMMLNSGAIFQFPAHKQLTDAPQKDVTKGCGLGYPFQVAWLRYARPEEDYADVSDLGVIKISQAFQNAHPFTYQEEDIPYRYNTVERLHQFLFSITPHPRWHRHKDLAYRSPLFHVKSRSWSSEYLTEPEMRAWLGLV